MKKVGLDLTLSYWNIPADEDGWVDAKQYLPADYDLCFLKLKDKKSRFGWSSGFSWDGLNITKEDEILYWKKEKEKKE